MNNVSQKLKTIGLKKNEKLIVMILGLGSVGTYLLDYLVSRNDESIEIIVVGRNLEKIESNVNIVKVASLIRGLNKTEIIIENNIDFENIQELSDCIKRYKPDFIVNSSRVYSGLKYGTISWNNLRAYGIWSPLAIKYIRNIMEAVEVSQTSPIVINTSYSDAVIPWLKSAGKLYPDFGSGNLNHLVPRIKFAISKEKKIEDFWNLQVIMATSHFHDVVISKEGHTEKQEQLIKVFYKGEEIDFDQNKIFSECKIAIPTDSRRNMMNASSNYEIISTIIEAVRKKDKRVFLSPGAFGEIGGYPIYIDGKDCSCAIDTEYFTLDQMRTANRKSIALDGIENVIDGKLIYTDHLLEKIKDKFNVSLNKEIHFDEIDETAEKIIREIIQPNVR